MFCRRILEFDLIWYLTNKTIPDKNGVLDILNHMVNVAFMLDQRRRQLAYINPALSILQRKQDRSTPNVFLMLGMRRKRWTNIKPILGQCVVVTETAHQ